MTYICIQFGSYLWSIARGHLCFL